jgi:hypothetical protein
VRFEEQVGLEVERTGAGRAARKSTLRARVVCDGSLVTLDVEDRVADWTAKRQVDLSRIEPSAQGRFLALLLAEMADRDEPPAPIEPEPEPETISPVMKERTKESEVVAVRPVEISTTTEAYGRLSALGSVRTVFGPKRLTLIGAHASASRSLAPWLRASAAVAAEEGQAAVSLGVVHATVLSLETAVVWQSSMSHGTIEAGLGVDASIVRLRGAPSASTAASGKTSVAPVLSPLACIGLSIPILWGFAVEVRGIAGWVTLPTGALVAGQREVAFDGPWISALVGIAFSD